MLAEKLKSPPQEPVAPEAPQLPQFNPLALKLMREGIKNPPQPTNALAAWNAKLAAMPNVAPSAPEVAPSAPEVAPTKVTKKNGEIKFDTKTIMSGAPIQPEQTVMHVDPVAFQKAYQATDPEFAKNLIAGRTERLKQFVAEGNPVALPEVGAVNGRLGVNNGRHRLALAAEQGLKQVPIAVDKGNEQAVKDVIAKHSKGLDIPEDLSIPDFLKRLPQPVAAQKALAKVKENPASSSERFAVKPTEEGIRPVANFEPEVAPTAEELKMSPKEYAAHVHQGMEPEALGKLRGFDEKFKANVERKVQWKQDTSEKLAKAVSINQEWVYRKLLGARTQSEIRTFREQLKKSFPQKAGTIDDLLADPKLRPIWKYVGK